MLVGSLAHLGRVIGRGKMDREAGKQRTVWQFEGRLQYAARIALLVGQVLESQRVQYRGSDEWQLR